MRIAAYCRVSTEKEDQLNSLEMQKKFFTDYVEKEYQERKPGIEKSFKK